MEISKQVQLACLLDSARNNLMFMAKYLNPALEFTNFHRVYYEILDRFAKGKIKKLIVTVPPQHGKSEGSSRMLPVYLFGHNPNLKIVIGSYSGSLAADFNRDCQKLIDKYEYSQLFPNVSLRKTIYAGTIRRTATMFDIVGHEGSLRAVGRSGGLTGRTADIVILDDVFADYMEANSPVIRESVWRWYTTVVRTRLHNDSQQLIVFTRWHEEDIIGKLEKLEPVILVKSLKDIENVPRETWIKINFQAIKESEPTDIDPRPIGEPLFPSKHGREKLEATRRTDPIQFESLYQGDPTPQKGLLYGDNFETYDTLPDTFGNGNYTDTADSGDDHTCSVSYRKGREKIYVTDVVYTQDNMDKTEITIPLMFERSDTRYSHIESNSGGRYFATKVAARAKRTRVLWFHQGKNKESRIITNSATVLQTIVMPVDWKERWPEFALNLLRYKRLFKANRFHDAADVLTGIIEKEHFGARGKLKRRG